MVEDKAVVMEDGAVLEQPKDSAENKGVMGEQKESLHTHVVQGERNGCALKTDAGDETYESLEDFVLLEDREDSLQGSEPLKDLTESSEKHSVLEKPTIPLMNKSTSSVNGEPSESLENHVTAVINSDVSKLVVNKTHIPPCSTKDDILLSTSPTGEEQNIITNSAAISS